MHPLPRRTGDASTTSASLSISSGEASFAAANRWFERVLDGASVPDDVRADLLLVFEEAVVNVIAHGFRETAGELEINVERTADALTLTLRDNGPPFDPLAHPEPDLQRPVAERPIGGLGVHLLKRLCDRIRYLRDGESNILVMTKQIH